MKKLLLPIIVVMVIALGLSACATPNNAINTSSLSVTGIGQVNLAPDIAYVYLGVQTESESVSEAVDENTEKSRAVSNLLDELGLEKKDIQTTAFNVYPTQEYDIRGEPTSTKYIVNNTVRIIVRDLNNLGELLDAVVNVGANNITNIQFDIEDKNAAFSEARKLAIQNARQQAEEIAAAADVELGDVINLNVYSSGGGVPYYGEKMFAVGSGGGGDVPITSGQLIISADANIIYEIR